MTKLDRARAEVVRCLAYLAQHVFNDDMRLTLIASSPTNPDAHTMVSACTVDEIRAVLDELERRGRYEDDPDDSPPGSASREWRPMPPPYGERVELLYPEDPDDHPTVGMLVRDRGLVRLSDRVDLVMALAWRPLNQANQRT